VASSAGPGTGHYRVCNNIFTHIYSYASYSYASYSYASSCDFTAASAAAAAASHAN